MDNNSIRKRDAETIFKRKNVFLIFVLSCVTFGIYPCVWFLKFKSCVDANPRLKFISLSKGLIFTTLAAAVLRIPFMLITPHLRGTLDMYSPMFVADIVLRVLRAITVISLLAMAFKSCDLINDYCAHIEQTDIRCSKFPAFFLNIFYLQYKISG